MSQFAPNLSAKFDYAPRARSAAAAAANYKFVQKTRSKQNACRCNGAYNVRCAVFSKLCPSSLAGRFYRRLEWLLFSTGGFVFLRASEQQRNKTGQVLVSRIEQPPNDEAELELLSAS